jgi:hypothetical protein
MPKMGKIFPFNRGDKATKKKELEYEPATLLQMVSAKVNLVCGKFSIFR